MTTDAFHVKLDDDHFYGILQIELAYIYIYILVFKEDESGRFFVRLILPMFCRFGVSVIFEPFLKNLDRSED